MAAEDEVRQVSDRFYAALNRGISGDIGPMSAVWSHSADVTTMHPMGEREVGWEQAWPVFQQAATVFSAGQVRLRDQLIRVGTDLAYEIGIEEGEAMLAGDRVQFKHRVTNVYRREGGEWKIVHHHTDPSPAMNEVLSRL